MFRIYQGDSVVVEGESPLAITGVAPNTSVNAGEYQAVRVEGDRESERVDIPAFTTLPIAVTGVSVNPTTLSLDTGATGTLTATVAPTNATDTRVSWESSNNDVATVNDAGTVNAVSAGSATITVTTVDGGHTATCEVTVTDPVINVTGVSVSPQTSTAEAGTAGSRQLTVTIEPENATNKNVTYNITPSATGLSVSDTGRIEWTEETPANVYVTEIKTEDGNHVATHSLTLTEPEEPEGIIIPRELEMLKGTTEQLSARETVRWLSSNESVISVDNNGVVTANEKGVAEVIATTTDDREDEITVVVLESQDSTVDPNDRVGPTSITLDPSEHTIPELFVNKLIKIHIEPTNAETDVEWTSSDESIVGFNPSLGGKGWIQSRGVGTATITARSTVNGVEGTATIHAVNG